MVLSLFGGDGYKDISAKEAFELYKKGVLFIDIRSQGEYEKHHPVGSKLVVSFFDQKASKKNPLFFDQFYMALGEDEEREVVIICRTGTRTKWAAKELVKLGYTNIYNVTHGYVEWMKAGLPRER